MKKGKTLITVVGNIASGKSTMAKFLAKELKAKLVLADEFYKTNPFFRDTLQDRKRWSLASDLWFLVMRLEMMEKLVEKQDHPLIVQDSGVIMSLVYAHSRLATKHMDKKEYELYQLLYRKLAKKINFREIIVYLDSPVNLLLERIKKRGRQFEIKFHKKSYLEQIKKSLEYVIETERKNVAVIRIDGNKYSKLLPWKKSLSLLITRLSLPN